MDGLVVLRKKSPPFHKGRIIAEEMGGDAIIEYILAMMAEQVLLDAFQLGMILIPVVIQFPEVLIYPMRGADDAKLVVGVDRIVVKEDEQLVIPRAVLTEILHLGRPDEEIVLLKFSIGRMLH